MSKKNNLKNQLVDMILDEEEKSDFNMPSEKHMSDPKTSESKQEDEDSLRKSDATYIIPTQDSDASVEEDATNTLQKIRQSFSKVFQPERKMISSSAEFAAIGAEEKIAKAESIQLAQERITELEEEVDSLRGRNEELLAAGEVLKKKTEELRSEVELLSKAKRELEENFKNEIQVLEAKNNAKEREISDLKIQVESLELRLKADLKTVRVRERELENRLELMKAESTAIVRSKDELILELKRNLDQAMLEMENYKEKGRKLNQEVEGSEERIRRAVKAMRLAMNLLEGESSTRDEKKNAS